MSAIKPFLLPGEQVLFIGRVHSVVYLKGLIYLLLAYALWRHGAAMLGHWPWLARIAGKAAFHLPALAYTRPALTILLGVWGTAQIVQAGMIAASTELAVTTDRVIAKYGIATTTTLEMERHKVAGIVVVQPILGRLLDYGWVWIRGFSGDIHGLPPIARPRQLQAAIGKHG